MWRTNFGSTINRPTRGTGVCLAVGLVLLVCYLAAAPPGLMWGDSNELLYGLKTFQTVHPPGYPTYLLTGKVLLGVSGLPVVPGGHWLSALYSVLAWVLFFWFLRKRNLPPWICGACVGFLGFSYPIWRISIKTEVYSFALLLVSLSLILWANSRHRGTGVDGLCLLAGVGLTHHPIGLFNLFLAWDAFRSDRYRRPIQRVLLFVLPGLIYLSLLYPVSDFPFNWPRPGHPRALLDHMLGGNFRSYFLKRGVWTPLYQFGLISGAHLVAFPVVLMALVAAGYTRVRGVESVLIYVQGGFLLLLLLYDVPDLYDFLIPSYLVCGLFLGRGLEWTQRVLGTPGFWGVLLVGVIGMVGVVWTLDYRYDFSGYTLPDDYAQSVSRTVDEGVIITDWGHYTPLRYHQLVRGGFGDVELLVLSPFKQHWGDIASSIRRRDTRVYTTIYDWPVPNQYTLAERGQVYEIRPRGP